MKRYTLTLVLVFMISILAVGCTPASTPSTEPPSQGSSEEPLTDPGDLPYPGPENPEPVNDDSPVDGAEGSGTVAYPGPNDAPLVESQPFVITTEHEFAPAVGDSKFDRGKVFIKASDIFIMESFPMQVRLQLTGELPTPCNQLRAIVSPPNQDSQIHVEVYSVSDPEVMCTQVLEPFEVLIPIGNFTQGSYTIIVNGEQVGSLDFP